MLVKRSTRIFNLTMFVRILLAVTENVVSSSISYIATGTDNYIKIKLYICHWNFGIIFENLTLGQIKRICYLGIYFKFLNLVK